MSAADTIEMWRQENLCHLRTRVNDRHDHRRQIADMYYGDSANTSGQLLDGASDGVEATEQFRPIDSAGDNPTEDTLLSGHLVEDHLLRSAHLLQLDVELIEARLDLIEATLNISHGRSLDAFDRLAAMSEQPLDEKATAA